MICISQFGFVVTGKITEVRQDDDGEVSLLVACRQRGTAPWRAGTDVDAAVCSSERFGRAVGCSEADSPSASGRRLDG